MKIDINLKLTVLDKEHLTSIVDMEDEFLNDASICARSSKDVIEKCLKSQCSVGIFVNDILVAYSLAYATEYSTGYIEKSFVIKSCRGFAFQQTMVSLNIKLLFANGANEIFTMTSPLNSVSMNNFQNVGFCFKCQAQYNGYDRAILKLEL